MDTAELLQIQAHIAEVVHIIDVRLIQHTCPLTQRNYYVRKTVLTEILMILFLIQLLIKYTY